MKTQCRILWLGCLVLLLIITSCTQSKAEVTSPSPTLPASKLTTKVITPTPKLGPKVTVRPTFTATAVATLSLSDGRNRLLDLLSNNGGCQLPCLWGITPGKSTNQEAENLLIPLSSISELTDLKPSPGEIQPVYSEDDLFLSTKVTYLYANNGVVSSIAYRAREERKSTASNGEEIPLGVFDSLSFGKRLDYYSLSHVLSEQGIPTSVLIATSGPPAIYLGGGGFYIALLYPDKGIWVNYITQMYIVGDNVRGRPTNAHVEMELYPPGDSASFFALLDKTDWGVKKNGYKPLEEATQMTVEQFYQTFRNPTDKWIETPAKLWPTPEPSGP